MQDKFMVLTVGTGNVCRSPLAAQLLSHRLRNVPEIEVTSAGTQALVGHSMTDHAQGISRGMGVAQPETHRARALTAAMLDSSDLILAMSREHRRAVVDLNPRVLRRVFTIREFARLAEKASQEDLRFEIGGSLPTAVERLRIAVKVATYARGQFQPLDNPADDDVIDPYQRRPRVYTAAMRQLTPAVKSTATLLRGAVEGISDAALGQADTHSEVVETGRARNLLAPRVSP